MEAFDLPGRRRRARCGEQVTDAVLLADPIEENSPVTWAEAAGEDLAVEFLRDVKRLRL
jgi:hypothetical protein